MSARIILGVAYVFAHHNLQKPFHTEVVQLIQIPVLCHHACGLYYVPEIDPLPADAICPDCGAPPLSHRMGEADRIEVAVRMQFGDVIDVSFLRVCGKVERRFVGSLPVTRGNVSQRALAPKAG